MQAQEEGALCPGDMAKSLRPRDKGSPEAGKPGLTAKTDMQVGNRRRSLLPEPEAPGMQGASRSVCRGGTCPPVGSTSEAQWTACPLAHHRPLSLAPAAGDKGKSMCEQIWV